MRSPSFYQSQRLPGSSSCTEPVPRVAGPPGTPALLLPLCLQPVTSVPLFLRSLQAPLLSAFPKKSQADSRLL